jgi:hypothetical protein
MKPLLKRLLVRLMAVDPLWHLVRHAGLPGVAAARRKVVAPRLVARFAPPCTVRTGPFRGLVYPATVSAGSALLPKLLGTYESELHGVFEAWAGLAFATIVDVGCAEGYYAVGLARRYPGVPVLAYDIAEPARRLCAEMARANGAAAVQVRARCDPAELCALPAGQRHLVISDCEGFELALFTDAVVRHLAASHVVIELHDNVDPSISRVLGARFAATHRVELVGTVPETQKAADVDAPELGNCDAFERAVACAENRGCAMAWLVAAPRGGG